MDLTFFKDLAERLVKTAAQAALAAIGTTAYLGDVDWQTVGSVTAMATILSVLTSVATGARTGTASLVTTPAAGYSQSAATALVESRPGKGVKVGKAAPEHKKRNKATQRALPIEHAVS